LLSLSLSSPLKDDTRALGMGVTGLWALGVVSCGWVALEQERDLISEIFERCVREREIREERI
jgi:hypothetical protein